MTPRSLAVAALLMVLCGGCSRLVTTRCPAGEKPSTMDTLYFGAAFPKGEVSKQQWEQFLADIVTPRFPNGLTSWPAAGQWRGESGKVQKESSYVLNIVHAEQDGESAIREIIADYKTRYQQEAVLRVRSTACISF